MSGSDGDPDGENPEESQASRSDKFVEEKLRSFSTRETRSLIDDFQRSFDQCVEACKKPNILVTGITGAGKSTLINAIFGSRVAECGVGLPVTQHYSRFEPENHPIVIYDSKGLEWNEHEKYVLETTTFFRSLMTSDDVSQHIHCIWYVINAGRGRIDPFELELVRDVFSPTPVLFVLNKADLADAEQLKRLKQLLLSELGDVMKFVGEERGEEEEREGEESQVDEKVDLRRPALFVTVADRGTFSQAWCPACLGDDVFYDEETQELECVQCSHCCSIEPTLGLPELVSVTTELLPEFAKDAFVYCQAVSRLQKDERAKVIVKEFAHSLKIDWRGGFISQVAEMCARLFVVWGYPLTGQAFRDEMSRIQASYIREMSFQRRLIFSSIDLLLQRKISKSFAGLLGLSMNSGMKFLNEQLIQRTRDGTGFELSADDFMAHGTPPEETFVLFLEAVFFEGVDSAIDAFWNITEEEFEDRKESSKMLEAFEETNFREVMEEHRRKQQEQLGEGEEGVAPTEDGGDEEEPLIPAQDEEGQPTPLFTMFEQMKIRHDFEARLASRMNEEEGEEEGGEEEEEEEGESKDDDIDIPDLD